ALPFGPQPTVMLQSGGRNTISPGAWTATLSTSARTPTSGGPGTLSGCTQSETSGVITFSGCKIDTAGTSYKLHATDGGLTATDKIGRASCRETATTMVFALQPSNSNGHARARG